MKLFFFIYLKIFFKLLNKNNKLKKKSKIIENYNLITLKNESLFKEA